MPRGTPHKPAAKAAKKLGPGALNALKKKTITQLGIEITGLGSEISALEERLSNVRSINAVKNRTKRLRKKMALTEEIKRLKARRVKLRRRMAGLKNALGP